MLVYNYDPETKLFTYSEEAFIDPLASKKEGRTVYFLPANATFSEPYIREGWAAQFDEEYNRWRTIEDNRGRYAVDYDFNIYVIDYVGEVKEGFCLITDEQKEIIEEHPHYYLIVEVGNSRILIKNPNCAKEEAAIREAEFNKAFFETSLGYVRRIVTMQDGNKKDFLSDLLPAIATSVQLGKAVNILVYDKPPFDEDVEEWTEYQHIVTVTPQFINECFMQLGNDFLPINLVNGAVEDENVEPAEESEEEPQENIPTEPQEENIDDLQEQTESETQEDETEQNSGDVFDENIGEGNEEEEEETPIQDDLIDDEPQEDEGEE